MNAEQVITLLQICGYTAIIPAIICMVGVIVTYLRPLPDLPPKHTMVNSQHIADPVTYNATTRPQKKKRKAGPSVALVPVVVVSVPPAAEKRLSELTARFRNLSSNWTLLSPSREEWE